MSDTFNILATLAVTVIQKASINNPLADMSETSVDRLEELRREILTGSYHVDAEHLASAMLRSQSFLGELANDSLDKHLFA